MSVFKFNPSDSLKWNRVHDPSFRSYNLHQFNYIEAEYFIPMIWRWVLETIFFKIFAINKFWFLFKIWLDYFLPKRQFVLCIQSVMSCQYSPFETVFTLGHPWNFQGCPNVNTNCFLKTSKKIFFFARNAIVQPQESVVIRNRRRLLITGKNTQIDPSGHRRELIFYSFSVSGAVTPRCRRIDCLFCRPPWSNSL